MHVLVSSGPESGVVAGATARVVADGTDPLESGQLLEDAAADVGFSSNESGAGRPDVARALGR